MKKRRERRERFAVKGVRENLNPEGKGSGLEK
jgi:hypothetical protein